jgi:hypothetical protein
MARHQHDGIPIVCGRPECGRELCRALPAKPGGDVAVVLVDVRREARLAPAETGPAPVRRWHLTCWRVVMVNRGKRRCGWRRPLRVDRGRLVDLVRDPGGRRRLVLGVDL